MKKYNKLPKVRNVNKGKRRTRKHHLSVYDPIVFKWLGNRHYGFIDKLTKTKDGFAAYTVRSSMWMGCVYHDMELDDPKDIYSFIASDLSPTKPQLKKIKEHIEWRIKYDDI